MRISQRVKSEPPRDPTRARGHRGIEPLGAGCVAIEDPTVSSRCPAPREPSLNDVFMPLDQAARPAQPACAARMRRLKPSA
jgi:hypothetical protein